MNQRHLALSLLAAGAITSIATSQARWGDSEQLDPIAVELVGATQLETTVILSSQSDRSHAEQPALGIVIENIEIVGDSGEALEMELSTGSGPVDHEEASDAEFVSLWLDAECDAPADCEQEFTFSMAPNRELADGELVAFELRLTADISGLSDGDIPDPVADLDLELGVSTLSATRSGELLIEADDNEVVVLQVEADTLDEAVGLEIELSGEDIGLVSMRLKQADAVLEEANGDEVLSIPACDSGADCSEGYILEILPGEFAPSEAIEWHATVSVSSDDEIPAGHLSVAEVELGL